MTKRTRWMLRLGRACLVGALIALVGCGVLSARKTDYDTALRTAEGQSITVEDVLAIMENADLSDNDKFLALQELGIEDDDLIQALFSLTSAQPAG
ncbi:MAG TPA: hypothetical protein VM243_17625 [Phycisphaerae bacterium]|nr:hypothetical protein [Phycisphaerae bacterium]